MEKVNPKDFTYRKQISKKSLVSEITKNVIELKEGEAIKITKEEWKLKTSPRTHFSQILICGSVSVYLIEDGSGWVITCLKKFTETNLKKDGFPENYPEYLR